MSTLHTQPGIGEFSSLLKVMRQLVFFISAGREFHSRGPATEKTLTMEGSDLCRLRWVQKAQYDSDCDYIALGQERSTALYLTVVTSHDTLTASSSWMLSSVRGSVRSDCERGQSTVPDNPRPPVVDQNL